MSAMNDDEWYVLKDFDGFVNSTRALIFNTFGYQQSVADDMDPLLLKIDNKDIDEIDKVLSFNESSNIIKNIAKKQRSKTSKKFRYIINDILFADIVNSLNDRMISNMLNNLVNRGLIETAYDSESNDFVFWIKDNVKNKLEKPETD